MSGNKMSGFYNEEFGLDYQDDGDCIAVGHFILDLAASMKKNGNDLLGMTVADFIELLLEADNARQPDGPYSVLYHRYLEMVA